MKTDNPVSSKAKRKSGVVQRGELIHQSSFFCTPQKAMDEGWRDMYENMLRNGDMPQSHMPMNRSGLYTDFI